MQINVKDERENVTEKRKKNSDRGTDNASIIERKKKTNVEAKGTCEE